MNIVDLRHDLLDALIDAHAVGVEADVVLVDVAHVDVEVPAHHRLRRLVVLVDDALGVLRPGDVEALHHAPDALAARRRDADAHRVRHLLQQRGGAPAAQDDAVVGLGLRHDLVGG